MGQANATSFGRHFMWNPLVWRERVYKYRNTYYKNVIFKYNNFWGIFFLHFQSGPCCLPLYTDGRLELAQFQAAQMDRCWPETYGVCEAPSFPRSTEPVGTSLSRCKWCESIARTDWCKYFMGRERCQGETEFIVTVMENGNMLDSADVKRCNQTKVHWYTGTSMDVICSFCECQV